MMCNNETEDPEPPQIAALVPSFEQMEVIRAIKDGHNVQVDAVAGSGKTTTVLGLADHNSDKIIIQLTYNTELKEEVNLKKVKYNETMYLDNLSIYTYHGLAYQFYSTEAKTDIGIHKIVNLNLPPRRKLPTIHILVLDEIQDMNELYFEFVNKFLRDMNREVQLLVLGDKYQGLYEFKGADTRFLTHASKIWGTRKFVTLKLSTSYRVTEPIAKFVNNVMLGERRILAPKKGPPVVFIRHTNAFECAKIVAYKLSEQIEKKNIKPDDIFILAASVKSENSPLKLIENILVRKGIPCYIPTNETSTINSEVIKNKVIFASFHQSKGRERKMVIVYGFDNNYFKFFNRDSDSSMCPSTLYVAATRATEQLIVIESDEPLEFLKQTHNQMCRSNYITFEGVPLGLMNNTPLQAENVTNIIKTTPTELIKFLSESVLLEISDLIEEDLFTTDNKSFPLNNVKIQTNVETQYWNQSLHEEVYDINGVAIPALFEETYSPDKTSTIKSFIQEYYTRNMLKNTNLFYVNKIKEIDLDNMTLQDHLKMVTLYMSIQEKLMCKVAQIHFYNWLEQKDITKLFNNMLRHIQNPADFEYEKQIIRYKPCQDLLTKEMGTQEKNEYTNIDHFLSEYVPNKQFRFSARVDAMTNSTVWEFKCTDSIEIEHLLQVIIYAWIWKMEREEKEGPRIFKIMNIRTAEVQTLVYKTDIINKIIVLIIKSKYTIKIPYSDDIFIARCMEISSRYNNV